jgi:PKD repeat protein
MKSLSVFKTVLFVGALLACARLSAQTSIVNHGTVITIQKDAVVFVSGDYEDRNNAALDEPLLLSGTLVVGGNVYNNSPLGTKLVYEFPDATEVRGTVRMVGNNQAIGGDRPSFFPNLEIATSSSIQLQNDIIIEGRVRHTQGELNLNGRAITLKYQTSRLEENGAHRITGYPGVIETPARTISPAFNLDNHQGIGLGYNTTNGANPGSVIFQRMHGPGNLSVADGANVLRVFKMSTVTTHSFERMYFHYHPDDLNGLSASNLAFYYSNNGGATWIKATTHSHDLGNRILTARDVPFVANQENYFVLAANQCNSDNRPNVTITSPSAAISAGVMNICDQRPFSMSVPDVDGNYYRISHPNPAVAPVYERSYSIANITFTDNGIYRAYVRTPRGCDAEGLLTVNVRAIPSPSFSISPDPNTYALCYNDELLFDDTSTTSDNTAITQWSWNFGDTNNTTSSEKSPRFIYPGTGEHHPRLIVTSQYGCISPPTSRPIYIQTLPDTDFEITNGSEVITEICEDLPVHFVNHSTYSDFSGNPSSTLSYQWDFRDNNSSTAVHPVHAFETHGTYEVVLRATVNATGCHSTVSKPIQVNPEPVPLFQPRINGNDINEVCEGVYMLFENESSMPGNTGITFHWDFADGNTSAQLSPLKQFIGANAYTVTLTATSVVYGCTESFSYGVIVHPAPAGTFTVDDPDICPTEEAVFTNESTVLYGALSYEWNFGDGSTSTESSAAVRHTYSDPRQYRVNLKRTSNHGCVNTVSRNLVVHPRPVVSFQHLNVCDGDKVAFYNNSVIQSDVIESFHWDFGEGSTSSLKDPDHRFPTHGVYPVSLRATSDFGCSDEYHREVTIYRKPSFNLGASVAACENEHTLDPYQGTAVYLPPGTSFAWYNQGGQRVSSEANLTVNQSGVYRAELVTPAPEGCRNSIAVPLFMFKPVLLPDGLQACAETILDAEAGVPGELGRAEQTFYVWQKDGDAVSTTQTLRVVASGNYSVTVTRVAGGASCSSTAVAPVTIAIPLELTLPPRFTICSGESIVIDAGVDAETYRWTNVQTGLTVGHERTVTVNTSGTYRITVTDGGCVASSVTEVVVSPGPAVSFGTDLPVACAGEPLEFTDYSYATIGAIVKTRWNFNGDEIEDQPSVVRTFPEGEYTVSLTAETDNHCSATYSTVIQVRGGPHVSFHAAPACAGEAVQFENTSATTDASFRWEFGDGTVSSEASHLKTFSVAGNHGITLYAEKNGCRSGTTMQLAIHAVPDLDFGERITTCGTSIQLDAGNVGASYKWFDPGNGNVLATTQYYTVVSDGMIGLEITNTEGCEVTDVASVYLNTPLVIDLGENRTVCDQVVLDAGYYPGASFTWSTAEGTRIILAQASGTYSVLVEDQNGCTGSAAVTLNVQNSPEVNLGTDHRYCEGEVIRLDAGDDLAYTYAWSTGATTNYLDVAASGLYHVSVSNGSCTTEASADVHIYPSPAPFFSTDQACVDRELSFINQTVTGDPVTYRWNFGDGTSSALAAPVKHYSLPDAYTVTLKAQNAWGCSRTYTHLLPVYPNPVAGFSILDGCTGTTLSITNTTYSQNQEPLQYRWSFDNGDERFESVPAYQYAQPGEYLVTLQVESAHGCSDYYIQPVVIGRTPSLSHWQQSVTACSSPVILDAGNAGSTYVWSTGTTQQTLQVSASGSYGVTITSPDGCWANAEALVLLNQSLALNFPETMEGCGNVLIDPGVDAATYLWSTGAQSRILDVRQTDDYWLQVISNDLCISRANTHVSVYPVPVIELGADQEACTGDVVMLSAEGAIPAQYEWSTGATTNRIAVHSSGRYTVKLTTEKGCHFEDQVQVTLHALPVIDFADEMRSCGTLVLDAGNTGSSYQWSTGAQQQRLTVSESDTYWVRIRNARGCEARDTVAVIILPVPVLNLGTDRTVCSGETITLDAGEAAEYRWSTGSMERTVTVGSTGEYSVTIMNTDGCSATNSVRVMVRQPVGLTLGPDRLLCNKQGITLSSNIEAVRYQWGSSKGLTSGERNIAINQDGRYWLTVTDQYNCTATDTIRVSYTTEHITAMFLIPSTVNQGDAVHFAQLTEPEPVSSYWTFGDGGLSTEKNPVHRYFKVGEFRPTLVVSNGICTDTLTKVITVVNQRFETDPPPMFLPTLVEIVKANVFPNPFDHTVKFALTLTTPAPVRISIYSLQGQVLGEVRKVMHDDTVEFDLSHVPNGVYLLRMVVENRMKVFKVVKTERF